MLTAPSSTGFDIGSASSKRRLLRFATLSLAVLQLTTIAAEIIVSLAFRPRYNWITNTISELGVKGCTSDFDPRKGVEACSPLAGVMNSAMIFSGICLIVLTLLLRNSDGFSKVAGILWALAGTGSIATGLVSLDDSPMLHQVVSMPLFFGGPLAILVGAFQFEGRVRVTGALFGSFALLLGVLFSTTDWVYGFGGIVERMVIWPALLWVLLITTLAQKKTLRTSREP